MKVINEFDRLPPQDIEAEKAVLGAILIENEAINTVLEIINENDFYRETHKVIFKAMLELYSKNEAIDLITTVNTLKNNKQLEDVGGIAYVTALGTVISTAANVKYHANIVYEKAIQRRLIRISTEIASKAYEGAEEIKEQLDYAEKRILEISTNQSTNSYSMAEDMLNDIVDKFAMLAENKGKATGIPTDFTDFDRITSGLQPSDFIIIAARPSMGKTALALNIVQNVALRGHIKKGLQKPFVVAFFSLEMDKAQLMYRMVCAEANVDSQRIRMGEINDYDWGRIWEACDKLTKAKIAIDDTPAITVLEMRSKARKIRSDQGRLDLIVVDYLQLMQGSKRSSNEGRQQEVSEISRSLKALARELNIPIIALSQLSRGVESRQVKRPMLSDLRDSGSIEQDADIVCLLYREDYYNQETENQNITELIVAKNRNGPVDTVNLFFHKKFTKFSSLIKKF